MPVFELTSAKTGQNYRADFDQPPSEADVDEAVSYFDNEAARAAGVDPEVLNQGPLGTFARGVPQELAKVGTGAIQGAADIIDKTSQSGLFSGGPLGFLSAAMRPAAQQAAGVAADLEDAADAAYPTNPFNAKAQTVASGFGQGAKLVAGGAIGKAAGLGNAALVALPLVSGGLSGVHEGVTKAEDIGVESPEAQIAMGLLFGTVEAGTEKMFGFGNKGATEALLNQFKQPAAALLKQAAKSIGGEAVEEIAAGSAQDLLTRAFADEDPANPGFTRTGVELPKLDRKMLERRGLEALGGAAGGTVFAGAQTLANAAAAPAPQPVPEQPLSRVFTRRDGSTTTLAFDKEPTPQDLAEAQAWLDQQPGTTNQEQGTVPNDNLPPSQTTPTPQPPAPAGAAAPLGANPAAPAASPLIGIAERAGAVDVDPLLPESTGELTAEDVADLEGSADTPVRTAEAGMSARAPILQNLPDQLPPNFQQAGQGMSEPLPPPASVTKGSGPTADQTVQNTPGAGLSPATGALLPAERSPEAQAYAQAVAQAAEESRLAQVAKLRARENQVGRGPVIPDSPLGVYDILDFVNENKIRVPRADSAERQAGEYDWTETYSVPQYYRKFLGSSDRGGSIDQVSQAAFENGFIREPTADALMGAIQQTIDTRKQYKVQFAKRAKEQAVVKKQTLDFEKTQQTLRRKDKERVDFEDIAPGDEMTIDGEQAVVKNVEYTEDGYLTNVVIEDGKRFGLMQFDPQTRSGLFVDEYTPRSEAPTGLTNTALKRDLEAGFMTTAGADALLDLAHSAFRAGQTFVQWSKSMLQRFGESIRQWLAGAWDHAKRSSQTGAVNFTGRLGSDLQKAASKAKASGPATSNQQPASSLQPAYMAAMQGRSSAMVPIKDVYAQAKAQNPNLTPEQFLAEVQAGDNAGTVLLEPFDTPQGLQAAGPFVVRNGSGVPSINMLVQRGFTHLDVSGQASQRGAVQFDSRTVDETRSRFASPREEDRQYETRADEAVLAEAEQYLDSVSVEAAVDAFVNGTVPLSGDAMVRAASRLLLRLNTATTAGTEVQRMWAHVQSQRMGRAWTSRVMSQDPARMLRQRAVANTDLISIAPILAAQEVLIDRADAVMDKRFDGGAEGAVEKVKEVIKNVDAQAGETLAGQLDTEMEEAPELGDNTDLQTGPDPRIADLEARLKELRTQMAAGDAAMQETTSTWQKILELLNAASQRKSAMLNGARSSLALARKAAQNRKAQRRAEGRLNANPVEDFADDAIIGTSFLAEGIVEFFNWGQAMIREIGARSNTELKQLYAAASKNYLDALKAEQAKPKKPTGKRTPARDKINKAQRTAQSILDELSRRYSDPPIFAEGQRKVNAMRELYKEHVKNPMAESTFVTRAQELGANAGTAGTLWEAANLEIDAREIMTREAMRAKLNPLLAQNSPALAKLLNSLRAKMFPGMKWADIFMELPSAQKDRQREIYKRLMKDERMKALAPGERLALTNELDKAWQRERRKVFNRELKKAGVIGEKDASDRAKVEKALPKLLRMINLGMFNSEMWREAVAPEYGLKMLTSADTLQLRTLAEAAWKLPEGVLRNQKLRDLLNGIQKKTGASWIEVLNSYWTAAVLSGLRTQFDTWLAAVNGMGTNLMQIGGLIARGRGKAAIDAHAQWWRGLIEGVRESGQILFKGDTSYLKRFGADLMKALEGETSVTPVPMGENLWRSPDAKTAAGRAFQKYGLAPVMMFTGRLMAAADHINNTATTQGAIAVARALHPELYQGRVGFTEAERANARTQALREVTGGREPQTAQERATLSARVRELLNGSVSKQDYADSSEIGDMAAFQNDPTGVFGIVYSAMKQGLGSIQRGLGNYAEDVTANRFARVASGIMAGSLHGITGTRFMRFGANFGAEMTRYIPGSYYVLGKAGFYGRNVSRMQQELLLGKNLVGLMIGSTLAAVFLAGDDDDEGWQIEGDWSTLTPQEAKARMAAGYERMTMWKRDGDKIRRISYKQWPTMGLFSVVGGMLDEKRHKPAQWAAHGTSGHLLRGLATGYVQVKNVSAVRNLVELFGDPAFSADGVTGAIDKFVKTSSNFAGGLMPTLVKDADIWSDPRNFKPEGVAEQFLRSVPIARKFINDGRPQLNLLGEEVKLQRSPWSRAYTSVESAEAHRVLGALMARGLSLPMPSDQIHVFKDGIKVPLETLGREAVWKYEKAVGQAYKEWLNLEGSDLLQLPVKQADAVIKRRAEAIKSRAKAAVTR